jgi:hypothetical protein
MAAGLGLSSGLAVGRFVMKVQRETILGDF